MMIYCAQHSRKLSHLIRVPQPTCIYGIWSGPVSLFRLTSGLYIRHRRHHPLPEREQVVDGVGRELPHAQGLHGELRHQLD